MDPPALLYDGDCSFCTRWARWLRRWLHGRLELVPAGSARAAALAPALTADDHARQVWLVADERTYGGAEAIARAVALRPAGRPAAWLYAVPGLRQLADAVYRWVADHRACLGGRCAQGTSSDREDGLA